MWSKICSALKPRPDNDNESEEGLQPAFCTNATTYYTSETMMSPLISQGGHSRTASREEDMIWSLRTQLAFQQELCTQYEIDLGARDELVQGLTTRLDFTEKENEKRKNTLRSWKKKAVELEKMCRHLEDEVDTSRQETLERSIMDEATGEALRQLHSQISSLEREKEEVAAKESILRSERDALELAIKEQDKELVALRDHIKSRDASEFILKESLPNAQQQEEVVSLRDEVRALEDRIVTMEEDWNEGENKKHALEETLQKALEDRESLEQERDQVFLFFTYSIIVLHFPTYSFGSNFMRSAIMQMASRKPCKTKRIASHSSMVNYSSPRRMSFDWRKTLKSVTWRFPRCPRRSCRVLLRPKNHGNNCQVYNANKPA